MKIKNILPFLNWLAGLGAHVVVQPDANDGLWANDPGNPPGNNPVGWWQPWVKI